MYYFFILQCHLCFEKQITLIKTSIIYLAALIQFYSDLSAFFDEKRRKFIIAALGWTPTTLQVPISYKSWFLNPPRCNRSVQRENTFRYPSRNFKTQPYNSYDGDQIKFAWDIQSFCSGNNFYLTNAAFFKSRLTRKESVLLKFSCN